MKRLPLGELERRCQKPDHRRLGNWMARRVSRPAALRVTWLVAPWGVTANMATLAAWFCGLAAAVAFGLGSAWSWLAGAALMQLWYLLDHVDGQLARLRGTASLDGVQLDYLMHHTVNLLVPIGLGWGLFVRSGHQGWAAAGLALGVALLLQTLHHDARYKAFSKRLKRVRGQLLVRGGGGATPRPQPPVPRQLGKLAAWTARKACEIHVITNTVSLLAVGQLLAGDQRLLGGQVYLALLTTLAVAVTVWTIARDQHRGEAEREFAAWYAVDHDQVLVFRDGWWFVGNTENASLGEETQDRGVCYAESS